jgi:hypothetical protein
MTVTHGSLRPVSAHARRIVDDELDVLLPQIPVNSLEGSKAVGNTEAARSRAVTVHRLEDPRQRALGRVVRRMGIASVLMVSSCFSDAGGLPTGSGVSATTTDGSSGGTQADDTATASSGATNTTEDPADNQCGSGLLCVPPVPSGWSGPVSLYDAAAGLTPGCAGDYPSEVWSLGADVVASGACVCACGDATDVACAETMRVEKFEDADCASTPQIDDTLPLAQCLAFTPNGSHLRVMVQPSGTCSVSESPSFVEPAFMRSIVACGGASSGTMCDQGTCVSEPQAPFDRGPCVWQAGEVDCPEGWGAEQVAYASIADQRDCTDVCTCGLYAQTCAGNVGALGTPQDLTCDGNPFYTSLGDCASAEGVEMLQGVVDGPPSGECVAEMDEVPPNGDAVGVEPVTFCCR